MIFEENATLLFAGDSITDANRNRDALPGGWSSWGEGYVSLINALLIALYPEKRWTIINQGISGNRVTDLSDRWNRDILTMNPDWITIMIGINDVWRHFDDAIFRKENQVTQEVFVSHYKEIIEKSLSNQNVKGVILLSAFMIENNLSDPMRLKLDAYNYITKKLAEQYDLIYIDVQSYFDHFLVKTPSGVLSLDRVHPSLAGHTLIAKAWLDAVGFRWDK
ncbi:SGNH/GDSL hydrolase family protein [Streptococcus sp. S784/96/1]|uniref:SGNH/GDSL hydrolase family protein n=1 Tax=Streptococcus sp. S784/96/1 TaxID=2653499 RepID=UPI00138A4A71|nr:SGNH/GDSL hydrolase family protein [Streptococcus sp. S784/96/1]